METVSFKEVLEMYKEGRISLDEAEQLIIGGLNIKHVPWNNDNTIYIAAFKGKRIIGKFHKDQKVEIKYEGEAVNVQSAFSLTCQDVQGNASAGTHITCGNIQQNAGAGTSITCGNVVGNVGAGTSVHCGDVGGSVQSGTSVTCGQVSGNVTAGSVVHIRN